MNHPYLIYGTAWKKARTAELVELAIRSGFRAVDTACQPKHYEEGLVGEGIERSGVAREELFVQTKFTPLGGQDPNRIPYDPNTPLEAQIARSLEVSLSNLRTTYLDSWVLHSPIIPYAQTLRAWRAMEQGVSEGKVRALGLSNCYELEFLERLYADATIKPTVIQNRFYADTDYDKNHPRMGKNAWDYLPKLLESHRQSAPARFVASASTSNTLQPHPRSNLVSLPYPSWYHTAGWDDQRAPHERGFGNRRI